MAPKVLIIEDEQGIMDLIQLYLENKGYQVVTSIDGYKGLEIVKRVSPDLILLDIVLPEDNGFTICKKIREISNAPIIFVSAKREPTDKLKGFEIGADDYITKPFNLPELEARIGAILRRSNHPNSLQRSMIKAGHLEIHLLVKEVYVNGVKVHMYNKEYELLLLLVQYPNQVFSAEQLYDQVWGMDSYGDLKTVIVHISNLRKKIEEDPSNPTYIRTVRGFGYKFEIPSYIE